MNTDTKKKRVIKGKGKMMGDATENGVRLAIWQNTNCLSTQVTTFYKDEPTNISLLPHQVESLHKLTGDAIAGLLKIDPECLKRRSRKPNTLRLGA